MSQFAVRLPLLMVLALQAQSEPVTFQSGAEQTALLELYTSEGCSSCPPAEAWLSRQRESPGLWRDFVPLAFHVDYWDYLGWRDPWSAREFSARQRAYAASWHGESVHTPCFVLNGTEWPGWRGRSAAPKSSGLNPGVLSVRSTDSNHWQVVFAPSRADAAKYEVHAALLSTMPH